jgi:hypothetical protein
VSQCLFVHHKLHTDLSDPTRATGVRVRTVTAKNIARSRHGVILLILIKNLPTYKNKKIIVAFIETNPEPRASNLHPGASAISSCILFR